jgi:hypothetical protein
MGTCNVCGGAIPEGEIVEGHTALCAEVARRHARHAGIEVAIAWLEARGERTLADDMRTQLEAEQALRGAG